jgi:hypothetical protein
MQNTATLQSAQCRLCYRYLQSYQTHLHLYLQIKQVPNPEAARYKAWVYGGLLSAIAGSNPTGDMDVCLV